MAKVALKEDGSVVVVEPRTAQELAEAEDQLALVAAALMKLALRIDAAAETPRCGCPPGHGGLTDLLDLRARVALAGQNQAVE